MPPPVIFLSPARGRGEERGLRTLSKDGFDLCPNPFPICDQLARREAHDPPTLALHVGRTPRISLKLVVMMHPIDLDHELALYADEVGEVRADRVLSAELDARHPVRAQQLPADLLRVSAVPSELPCSRDLPVHAPSPSLSP